MLLAGVVLVLSPLIPSDQVSNDDNNEDDDDDDVDDYDDDDENGDNDNEDENEDLPCLAVCYLLGLFSFFRP